MNRRHFLGLSLAATGGVFVPQYGRWYRQGSGLLVCRTTGTLVVWWEDDRLTRFRTDRVIVPGRILYVACRTDPPEDKG